MMKNIFNFNNVIPEFHSNEILMMDLKMLGLVGYNPFKISMKRVFAMNVFQIMFIVIPTFFMTYANLKFGYEKFSQSISEIFFELMVYTFIAIFVINQRKISLTVKDLKFLWRQCE